MGRGRRRVGNSQTGEQSSLRHTGSEIEIPRIGDHCWKRREDLVSGGYREFNRYWIDVAVPDAFKRMRQCVETGRDRQTLRHPQRKLGIDDRRLWIEMSSRERVLLTALRIPERRPHCDLATGTCGGRHSDNGQPAQLSIFLFRLEVAA